MTASADRRWAVAMCRRWSELPVRDQAALMTNRVAEAIGVASPVPVPASGPGAGAWADRDRWPRPPGGWAEPRLIGHLHEQAASPDDRKSRGAWYTPTSVVRGLTAAALTAAALTARGPADAGGGSGNGPTTAGGDDGDPVLPPSWLPERVIDPTCGGGAFLLAALDGLCDAGLEPAVAVSRVNGIDVDETAVEVSRWSVALWLAARLQPDRARPVEGTIDIRHGDALAGWPAAWTDGPVAVVGNPPFASPLKAGAVPGPAAELRRERSELLGPYADLGAVHLLNAIESVPAGSTVTLVQPQSVLAGRDTAGLRDWCTERGWLAGLWAARSAVFDAGVRPCAPILHLTGTGGEVGAGARPDARVRAGADGRPGPASSRTSGPEVGSSVDASVPRAAVALYHGADVVPRDRRPLDEWGPLAADALGAPALPPLAGESLEALATATAGFRDEHYALVEACREWEESPGGPTPDSGWARVVTVGSVDPLQVDWGHRPYRFGGARRLRPVVNRDELPPKVQRWFDRLRRPKVLLATQAKLLEPVIDRDGTAMPATPLIAVLPEPDDLDRVAAVLLAPPVALWAWRRWFGSAMSVDAVKLAARQVGQLPLPADGGAWEAAAELIGDDDRLDPGEAWDRSLAVAELMTRAYGADLEVLTWWRTRMKPRPSDGLNAGPGGRNE